VTTVGGALVLALVGCRSSTPSAGRPVPSPYPPPPARVARHVTIDLLALDLATCGRCTRTEANLDAALSTVEKKLREAGVDVAVRKTVVATAEQATRLRFESSPTIRVDGRDIALDLRESECGDCGELCGCSADVQCRVWVWEGKEYLEAPEPLIVEAVLRACREERPVTTPPSAPFRLPENLRRFFEAKERRTSPPQGACCDRATCCDPSEREACCGDGSKPCGCKK
jgi:hypothetical protein